MRTRRALTKKAKLAKALDATGLMSLFRRMQDLNKKSSLVTFAYHRVAKGASFVSQFDHTMFSTHEAEFDAHLNKMLKLADPVSESELIDAVYGNGTLPKRGFMITFDDGYKDNYEIAMPILKRLSIPAVFFLPSSVIDERKLGWWDLIYWCLKATEKKTIEVRGKIYQISSDVTVEAEKFTALIKNLPYEDTAGLVKEIQHACEVDLPTSERQSQELMTWDDAKQCIKAGITIGAHTHTHRVLSQLNLAEQENELKISKQVLEDRLGIAINSLAYPVGGYEHFNTNTKSIAQEVGYKIAYSFLTGTNDIRNIDAYDIKRTDHYLDEWSYAGAFTLPKLFAYRTCKANQPTPRYEF